MKNPEESKTDDTKNWLCEKKKTLRDTRVRNIHERKCELMNSPCKIERKSCYDTGAHFTDTGIARKGELYGWFKRISRCRLDLQSKIVPRQSAGSRSKSSICVEPQPKPATWYMEFAWYIRETFFWQSTYNARFITDTLSRNSSLYESKCYRWNPTERLVAKGEEQTGSTIPMPIFARRPSTMNSFSPAEISQNSIANQQRLQMSELHFWKISPHLQRFHVGR